MKLQLNPSTAAQAIPSAAPLVKSPEVVPGAEDGILISSVSTHLNHLSAERNAKTQRLTAVVQGDSYQVPSAEVSVAIVEDALTGRN